jgi:hypothetical protein
MNELVLLTHIAQVRRTRRSWAFLRSYQPVLTMPHFSLITAMTKRMLSRRAVVTIGTVHVVASFEQNKNTGELSTDFKLCPKQTRYISSQ